MNITGFFVKNYQKMDVEFYGSYIDKIVVLGIIKYICAYSANSDEGNTMNVMFIVLFLFYGKNLVRQRDSVLTWYCSKNKNV